MQSKQTKTGVLVSFFRTAYKDDINRNTDVVHGETVQLEDEHEDFYEWTATIDKESNIITLQNDFATQNMTSQVQACRLQAELELEAQMELVAGLAKEMEIATKAHAHALQKYEELKAVQSLDVEVTTKLHTVRVRLPPNQGVSCPNQIGSGKVVWLPKMEMGTTISLQNDPQSEVEEKVVESSKIVSVLRNNVVGLLVNEWAMLKGDLSSGTYKSHATVIYNEKVYVIETFHSRLQVFGLDGIFQELWPPLNCNNGNSVYPIAIDVYNDEVYLLNIKNHHMKDKVQVYGLDGKLRREWPEHDRDRFAKRDKVNEVSFGKPCNFQGMNSVVVHKDEVFVSNSYSHRIQVYTLDGTYLRQWGEQGQESGKFEKPNGMSIYNDELYVCDYGNDRIQVCTLNGTFRWAFKVNKPVDVSVTERGIYVADCDDNYVRVFTLDGTFRAKWQGHCGSKEQFMFCPVSIAAHGNKLYVCDYEQKHMLVYE